MRLILIATLQGEGFERCLVLKNWAKLVTKYSQKWRRRVKMLMKCQNLHILTILYYSSFIKIKSNVTQMNLSVCTRASSLSAKKMNLFDSLNSSCSFKACG